MSAPSPSPAPVTITYYLEILSSWCHWAEPAWASLKARYDRRDVCFRWRIAAMRPSDFPGSIAQNVWFYQRSGTITHSPYKLHAGWLEPERNGHYPAPNLVAEAARDFSRDREDDRARLALAHAALRDGQKIGDIILATAVAAKAAEIDLETLRKAASSPHVQERVAASSAEFSSHQINQRPAFIVTSAIGDKAVFSGLAHIEPLVATIDAMLDDTRRYASYAAHFGPPPAGPHAT